MPADLFIPNAIVQTSVYIFEAGTPHNFDYDVVKFIDFSNDGYKRTERCISEIDHPAARYQDLYLIYKLGVNAGKNPNFHCYLWDLDAVYCEDTISNSGRDWNFEQHKKTGAALAESDFERSVGSHFIWETGIITKQLSRKLSNNLNIGKTQKKEFLVSQLFDIDKTPSYNKDSLTKVGEKEYDYITRTAANRGICEVTGYIGDRGLNEAGTFSLGLLQMTFFYREREWYAGQFMRKVTAKGFELNQYTGIYFETVFSGLSSYLSSGLVRDVDEAFLSSKIMLPVDKDDNVDFNWIEQFVKQQKKALFDRVTAHYAAQFDV